MSEFMAKAARRWSALSTVFLFMSAGSAMAHPHILIKARAKIQFNPAGQLIGVRNIWNFDDAFSAYAIQGYDSKRDGKPTRQDLQPLADINVKSLSVYNFFTTMKIDGVKTPLGKPENYWDVFDHDTLTLRFTLPVERPVSMAGKTLEVDVYDPEYFAAIKFANMHPIRLVGGKGCTVVVHRPKPLDASIASKLAVIPVTQRVLPKDLSAITETLVNDAVISCP
ncbi:MAG TPA: DUF1007 family protein [Beijerinckiaceae bacterium]|nr:DUF1007 family protein [Beijerinckiaceae bacterium]